MKMQKKSVALAVTLMLAAPVFACSGGDEQQPETPVPAPEPTPAPEPMTINVTVNNDVVANADNGGMTSANTASADANASAEATANNSGNGASHGGTRGLVGVPTRGTRVAHNNHRSGGRIDSHKPGCNACGGVRRNASAIASNSAGVASNSAGIASNRAEIGAMRHTMAAVSAVPNVLGLKPGQSGIALGSAYTGETGIGLAIAHSFNESWHLQGGVGNSGSETVGKVQATFRW